MNELHIDQSSVDIDGDDDMHQEIWRKPTNNKGYDILMKTL